MLVEYLGRHPLIESLRFPPACPFPAAGDAAWAELEAGAKQALRQLATRYRSENYPPLPASRFLAFTRTGDRASFEEPYFRRRRKLCAALLGYCLDGGAEDLDALVDGVWVICEESSWVISAHNGSDHPGAAKKLPLPDVENPYVDLFAAQTAMILSLTCAMAGEALDGVTPLIRRRVRREVERRVLFPFETRDDFWWMGITRADLCNWTPWIVSNVMLSACAWVDDRLRLCALLERGCAMLDRYLAVLPDDGGCDEGPGYWSMAGGALLDCLELLERVTGGEMALWSMEKLGRILHFPLNAWLDGEWFVNFADCDARPDIPGERLALAGERLGDGALAALGRRFRCSPSGHLDDTPQLWRMLNELFHPHNGAPAADQVAPPADVWLPESQLRVVRRGGLALACKGGVNAGSHSHNDCGSFILMADGEPQLVDAGNMVYTAKTFSPERYTLWNTRGAWHSVPMIGSFEQVAGTERRATEVECLPDGLSLELAAAYPDEAGALSCRRTLTCSEHGCALTDVISIRVPLPVTEVFLLRHAPRIEGGALFSGGIRIVPDGPMAVSVEEKPVDDARMAKNYPGSLWRATFTAPDAAGHTLSFRIERNPS